MTKTDEQSLPISSARRMWGFACRMGVNALLANLGSDHPTFIEAFADFEGHEPRIVICPHEMSALSQRTGTP